MLTNVNKVKIERNFVYQNYLINIYVIVIHLFNKGDTMADNIQTTVQNGETIGLYSAMYGCTDDEIRKANNLKGDKLQKGQKLNIPIGKKWELPTKDDNVLQEKISYFDNKINEVHMQLYNTDLKPAEREKLEQKYINLMNQPKERQATASIDIAGNGINLVLSIKRDITVSEFRELFPECRKNFYKYADKTKQTQFIQGQGWHADPDNVYLHEGDKFMLKTQQYACQGGWEEFKTSFRKQFSRLDE